MVMLGLYFIFLTCKIDMTAWLASAGVVGIAAKDTLANLFPGVFILADSPYEIGDYIVIDSGERGKVTHIGLRSTRILTRDDLEITVPNSLIANGKIINESKGQHVKSRILLAVSVAYGSDIDKVRRVLLEEAALENGACTSPEPRVRFRHFDISADQD
jgi:MscS family membrane protein